MTDEAIVDIRTKVVCFLFAFFFFLHVIITIVCVCFCLRVVQGDNIKKFREESGAKINISDGTCPERIVTITGPTESILKAFSLICAKFEEMSQLNNGLPTDPALNGVHSVQGLHGKPLGPGQTSAPVTLRLVVPASQCGSLIGEYYYYHHHRHYYYYTIDRLRPVALGGGKKRQSPSITSDHCYSLSTTITTTTTAVEGVKTILSCVACYIIFAFLRRPVFL